MSGFVQLFGLGDEDEDGDDGQMGPRAMPAWFGRPETELGTVVPLGLVVGRSERGVVALPHVTAYSTGVAFDFVAAARGLGRAEANRLFHEQHLFGEDDEPAPGFLRVGLELPGGERVSNLGTPGRRRPTGPDDMPDGPVFVGHGGGGGFGSGSRVTMRPEYWLWPLPEPGTIRVFCEWPVVDIPLSTCELDGGELAAAAESVAPLWPAA